MSMLNDGKIEGRGNEEFIAVLGVYFLDAIHNRRGDSITIVLCSKRLNRSDLSLHSHSLTNSGDLTLKDPRLLRSTSIK